MNIIFKTKYGSHLYGTNTSNSDTDYKGVYLPTLEELILQKTSKSYRQDIKNSIKTKKNSKEDIDCEIYSLHYFIQLALKGETVALDMLHVSENFSETESDIWKFIRENRSKFYTKSLKSYIGYCRKQASKYGIKGSRLADAKKVWEFFSSLQNQYQRVADVMRAFPEGEHIKIIEMEDSKSPDKRAFEVCNRKIPFDCKVYYAADMVAKFYASYGERARKAEANEGIDWKAVSHAFRAGYQLKEIYETGDLKFPLKEAPFLTKVKNGEFHYKNDNIGQKLESLINEVEVLAEKSNYSEKPNSSFWEEFILNIYAK
jgi:hypothetical protein